MRWFRRNDLLRSSWGTVASPLPSTVGNDWLGRLLGIAVAPSLQASVHHLRLKASGATFPENRRCPRGVLCFWASARLFRVGRRDRDRAIVCDTFLLHDGRWVQSRGGLAKGDGFQGGRTFRLVVEYGVVVVLGKLDC